MASPALLDVEDEETTVRKLFVRCREPHLSFRKDKLVYAPMDDKEHKDDPPTQYKVDIVGYDEFGSPTCPVFEVEDGPEISDAINNDKTMHPVRKTPIFNGRLVVVHQNQLNKFPRYIGAPILGDDPLTVYLKVRRINKEKLKGDAILGKPRPNYEDCRMPHGEKASADDNTLYQNFMLGKELYEKQAQEKAATTGTAADKESATEAQKIVTVKS